MKYLQLTVIVCFLNAACSRDTSRVIRKTVRLLNGLCDAHNTSTITVRDPAFEEVLSAGVGEFCGPFYAALDKEPSGKNKTVNGVVVIKKVCKQFTNLHGEDLDEGPLADLEQLCNATTEAISRSLLNKASSKALARLTSLCLSDIEGLSHCSDVFEDIQQFCDLYLNDTAIVVGDTLAENDLGYAVKELGEICHWYTRKFTKEPADGVLGGLTVICADFDEDLCFPA